MRFLGFLLISIVTLQNVFAQKSFQSTAVEYDPFQISRGVSFSASVPKSVQKRNLSENGKTVTVESIKRDYTEALSIINSNYVDGKKINLNDVNKSAISRMLKTLDPHSSYFDSEEYADMQSDQRSEYHGIGASIANYTFDGKTDTYITSAYKDSPAFRAGLRFGDKIVSVNGEVMTDRNSGYVRDKIRGAENTVVRLTVEKADSKTIEKVTIRRGTVPQPSIPDAYMLRQGIGYIDLSNGFNYTTTDELDIALDDLRKQGLRGLILDLRNNPGGIVDQAVSVVSRFLPRGQTILTQRGRYEIDNRTWRANYDKTGNFPLVVLVNNETASASEIVAGALQDYDRALIVGETTFGKGLVQSVIPLPSKTGLTLTTAKYYTPSGRLIQRDYSKIGVYDYYRPVHLKDEKPIGKASKTITGRTVYGGGGIVPEEQIEIPKLNETELKLIDSLFFFSQEITYGRIANFEDYIIRRPLEYGRRVKQSDFAISEALFNAYKKYLRQNKNLQISETEIESEKSYIKMMLRFHFVSAAYGSVAASQVVIEERDPQVRKALESLPRAEQLALSARKFNFKN